MLKNLANCRNCQLYSNQLPLIDKKEECDVMWVGLSAKKVENLKIDYPLGEDTNSGKIIKEVEPDSEILYIGTTNRMEKDLIPSLGYRYDGLEVTGFKRKLTTKNYKTITNFLSAIKKSKRIIKDFNPDVVIGCGGYVTAPVIYAAKKLGKKTFIHEQNSVVGLANKFLARYTVKIGVSFESTIKDFPKGKAVLTGNPCSEKALTIKKANTVKNVIA